MFFLVKCEAEFLPQGWASQPLQQGVDQYIRQLRSESPHIQATGMETFRARLPRQTHHRNELSANLEGYTKPSFLDDVLICKTFEILSID